MKISIGLTSISRSNKRRQKFRAREKWSRWFAWHPIQLADKDIRWLEFVERKRDCKKVVSGGLAECWVYRKIDD